jgi:hypothetical protein
MATFSLNAKLTEVGSRISERPLTGELLVYAVLILASWPARLGIMRASIWTDEAWVANSILAPSWKEMFYYPGWVQVSPALFLALERLLTKVFGPSEPALRFLPLLAGLLAIPVLAIALRKLFSPVSALCGTSLVIANVWAAKYPQQVKQYGSDLFASALLCLLITRYCGRPDRRNFALLAGGFFVVSFLSNTALFMGPSVIAAVALGPLWGAPSYRRAGRLKIAITSFVLCGTLNYLVFIRPNRSAILVQSWADSCLSLSHPFTSARDLFSSFGDLLVPQAFPVTLYLGAAMVLVVAAGAVIALIGSARGSKKAVVILLLGPLPIAVAIVSSLLGQYPLLRFPRMLVWVLPCFAALLAAALDPLFDAVRQRIARGNEAPIFYSTAVVCLFLVLVLDLGVRRYPRPTERNREAMRLLHQSMGPSDVLLVHRRMLEQYYYYSRLQGWAARRVSVGNTDWPCCPRNGSAVFINPGIQSYDEDLRQAAALIERPAQVWMFLPSGQRGHSESLRWKIEATPGLMQRQSCYETHREGFDQSLVLAYECR